MNQQTQLSRALALQAAKLTLRSHEIRNGELRSTIAMLARELGRSDRRDQLFSVAVRAVEMVNIQKEVAVDLPNVLSTLGRPLGLSADALREKASAEIARRPGQAKSAKTK